ncbi:MAG: metallophosphoesterase [Phenylobacterium sp.]
MFRLAHLSDPHLPSPLGLGPLGELLSKRTLSRLSWRRKHRQHDPAVLAALVADLKAQAPDHVAVTGDLTNFSTPGEFAAARAWLETLGPTTEVTVSPGNHDALVARGHARRFETFHPWFGDESGPDFPQVRRRGPVALVNLCSAIATPPLFASGRLGADQLGRLGQVLDELKGLTRIVLVHHPVGAGVVSRRKALSDAPALREVLARHGAELILHGHAHEPVFGAVAGIPVLGVPSASSPAGFKHAPARWHLIEIEAGHIQVTARGVTGELGRYRLSAGIAA